MAQIKIKPESIQLIRLSDEQYFSDKYSDYISNSKLGLINPAQDGSIEKFNIGFINTYTDSFALGTAVHCSLLQPNDFFISKLDKTTGKLGEFVHAILKLRDKGYKIQDAINEAKVEADYYKNTLTITRQRTAIKKALGYYLARRHTQEFEENKEIIYLSATMKAKHELCMEAISKNKAINKLLYPQGIFEPISFFNEYAILCEIEVELDNGNVHLVKLKAKLDNFTVDHDLKVITLNDLKTTGKPAKFFMGGNITDILEDGTKKIIWLNGSFQKYHYYRQLGMYLWLLNAAMVNLHGPGYSLEANILLVETIPNFNTRVCKVNGNYINRGKEEFKELLIKAIEWTR